MTDVLLEIVRVLVDAGATPSSAVRAAVVLDQGGTTREAEAELETGDLERLDPLALLDRLRARTPAR